MSGKLYISGDRLFSDSFKLAEQVESGGWIPELLLVLWRGGAPVGMTIHEYFIYRGRRIPNHIIACSSYTGLEAGRSVVISMEESFLAGLKPGMRVLVVDDIFDTGRTAMGVRQRLTERGVEVRIATLYWKPEKNMTAGAPDYYIAETDRWVVFPHELEGLTDDEVAAKWSV